MLNNTMTSLGCDWPNPQMTKGVGVTEKTTLKCFNQLQEKLRISEPCLGPRLDKSVLKRTVTILPLTGIR